MTRLTGLRSGSGDRCVRRRRLLLLQSRRFQRRPDRCGLRPSAKASRSNTDHAPGPAGRLAERPVALSEAAILAYSPRTSTKSTDKRAQQILAIAVSECERDGHGLRIPRAR
jgi:hypothetical protein